MLFVTSPSDPELPVMGDLVVIALRAGDCAGGLLFRSFPSIISYFSMSLRIIWEGTVFDRARRWETV